MIETLKPQLREFIEKALAAHADDAGFSDDESLFASGRLDSFTMMNLVMYLEQRFGIDFASAGFDVDMIDSVDAIAALVEAQAPG
jgi:acyl carrier protein